MNRSQKKKASAFLNRYMSFVEKMRPDLAAIEDPTERDDELSKWLSEMEEPEKLLYDFINKDPQHAKEMTDEYKFDPEEVKGRVSEVKDLPMEDTVWLLDELLTLEDDHGQSHRTISMWDRRDHVLGCNTCTTVDVDLSQQCFDLVCACTLHPMVGAPRRPRHIAFKDPAEAKNATDLDLAPLGIQYLHAGAQSSAQDEGYIRMRECCLCHMRGSKDLFKKCSSCHAMMYCSKECQRADWVRLGKMADHSHKHWCARMQRYMARGQEMRELPFTYINETTSDDFDEPTCKAFLERHGVYNEGIWRRECQLWRKHGELLQYGELATTENPIVLPVEDSILTERPTDPPHNVKDWLAYYTYRGFHLDSPIAILLQWPLTLFYIVKYCLPNDNPAWWDGVDSSNLYVDIIGVEREVEMIDVFKEVGVLLPDVTVDIHMYGNELCKGVDGRVHEMGNITVTVHRQLYHNRPHTARKPHVVIGYNAGLAAYHAWSQTLVKLRTDKTPAYFTDYCQYSCECAKVAVTSLGLGTISEPVINPFRSPVRKVAEENEMPWYSNGFLYHIVYP